MFYLKIFHFCNIDLHLKNNRLVGTYIGRSIGSLQYSLLMPLCKVIGEEIPTLNQNWPHF